MKLMPSQSASPKAQPPAPIPSVEPTLRRFLGDCARAAVAVVVVVVAGREVLVDLVPLDPSRSCLTTSAAFAVALPLFLRSFSTTSPAVLTLDPVASGAGPETRSVFSTSPARRTQARRRVYLPRPPLGPIFSKWLSPYCQPSSSTCQLAKRFDSCQARPAEAGVV